MVTGLDRRNISIHLTPNEATRKSFRYGALVGAVALAVSTMAYGVLVLVVFPMSWSDAVISAPLLVVPIAIIMAVPYGWGAAAQHWLLRLLLFASGVAPLRYARWLNYATSLRLLYRGGSGGYIFIHQLLQEYFCDARTKPTPAPPPPPP